LTHATRRLGRAGLGLVIALAAAWPATAQDSVSVAATPQHTAAPRAHQRIRIGPVAGVNFATWTGNDVGSGATRRTGVHAGIMVTGELGRIFALQTGALYSQEGTGVELPGTTITGSFKVDYVRVPLLLQARMALPGSGIRPYALTGPALGIKVHCRIEAESGGQSAAADCDDPTVGLNLTTTDFGWVFGLGLDIGRFTVGGRYQLGLKSIDDTSNTASDVKNSLLALTAGYSF